VLTNLTGTDTGNLANAKSAIMNPSDMIDSKTTCTASIKESFDPVKKTRGFCSADAFA